MKYGVVCYGEVVLRCARRLNNHTGSEEAPRCDRIATHVVDGYALCEEHATNAARPHAKPHPSAVKVAAIRAYLKQLHVPGLIEPLKEESDGFGSVEVARNTATER